MVVEWENRKYSAANVEGAERRGGLVERRWSHTYNISSFLGSLFSGLFGRQRDVKLHNNGISDTVGSQKKKVANNNAAHAPTYRSGTGMPVSM